MNWAGQILLNIDQSQIREFFDSVKYLIDPQSVKEFSGRIIYRIDGNRILDFSGRVLLYFDGTDIKQFSGSIIGRFDGRYFKNFSGQIQYQVDGFVSHIELMALVAILYANYKKRANRTFFHTFFNYLMITFALIAYIFLRSS